MAAKARYDGNLQMLVEDRRDPDMRRLRFLRWLAESGRLEHAVAGAASGELLALVEPDDVEPFTMQAQAA